MQPRSSRQHWQVCTFRSLKYSHDLIPHFPNMQIPHTSFLRSGTSQYNQMDDYTSLRKWREHDFPTWGITKHKQQMSTSPFLPCISNERSGCEHKTWRPWEAGAGLSALLISFCLTCSEITKRDHSSNTASLLGKILVLLILWGYSLSLFLSLSSNCW